MAESAPPRFSVIIPTYNYGRYLPTALDSVLDQSRDDVEILVVDDASTDATPEIVSRYTRHVGYVRLPSNVGPARAWGEGLDRVSGRYVCKLDADDWQLPGFLEAMGAALDDAPSAGMAATAVFAYYELLSRISLAPVGAPAGLLDAPNFRLRLLGQFFFFMPGIMLRREALLGQGPPRPELWMAHDWEFLIRAMRGWSCFVLDEPLAVYRVHSGSVTQSGRTERLLADMTILQEMASMSGSALSLTDQEKERFCLAVAETYLRLTPLNLLRFDFRGAFRHVELAMQLAGGSGWGPTSSKARMLFRVAARKGKSHMIWKFGLDSTNVETLLPKPSCASN
ncbi:MAG: glycosyltransferase family 2 protein [Acidimicrobiia bacterium]